jgi:hypothetical protein
MVAVACGIKQGKDNGPVTLSGLLTIHFSHLRSRLAAPVSRCCDMPVAVNASGKVEPLTTLCSVVHFLAQALAFFIILNAFALYSFHEGGQFHGQVSHAVLAFT